MSGRKTAAEVCVALGVAQGLIYKWKVWADDNTREGRIGDLEVQGHNPESARRIRGREEELADEQKKGGEQAVIIDLLKNLRHLPIFQRESELNGVIATMRASGRRKGRAR